MLNREDWRTAIISVAILLAFMSLGWQLYRRFEGQILSAVVWAVHHYFPTPSR